MDRSVFEVMQEILVGALGVDESEVTMESRLVSDLGAESIDILDISFRIEEEYDVSLPTKQWTELFGRESGQLETNELLEHVANDFGLKFRQEHVDSYADLPLREILDRMEQDHGIHISEEKRRAYAELGTRGLVDGLGRLLHSTIDGQSREQIVRAATENGFDERFWAAVSNVFTVERLVHFVERMLEEQEEAGTGSVPVAPGSAA